MQKRRKEFWKQILFVGSEKKWQKSDGVEKKRHFVGWHFLHIDILSVTYWLATCDWEKEREGERERERPKMS